MWQEKMITLHHILLNKQNDVYWSIELCPQQLKLTSADHSELDADEQHPLPEVSELQAELVPYKWQSIR